MSAFEWLHNAVTCQLPIGSEWIIVAIIIVVLLLWGPQKIPELARALGQAKREFNEAARGAKKEIEAIAKPTSTSDEKLIEVAKSLGIATEGKTREQIAQEIIEKAKPKEK